MLDDHSEQAEASATPRPSLPGGSSGCTRSPRPATRCSRVSREPLRRPDRSSGGRPLCSHARLPHARSAARMPSPAAAVDGRAARSRHPVPCSLPAWHACYSTGHGSGHWFATAAGSKRLAFRLGQGNRTQGCRRPLQPVVDIGCHVCACSGAAGHAQASRQARLQANMHGRGSAAWKSTAQCPSPTHSWSWGRAAAAAQTAGTREGVRRVETALGGMQWAPPCHTLPLPTTSAPVRPL